MAERRLRIWTAAALAGLLAGCSQAPAYHVPTLALPAQFSQGGPWAPAAPALADAGGAWWRGLGDPVLDGLEQRLLADNPDLAAALARHQAAQALLGQARADTMPQVNASGALTANRQSDDRPLRGATQPDDYGAHTLAGNASYEFDLWGRIHNQVDAARADAQASADDAAALRLSLSAELASTYIALRGSDAEIAILNDAMAAFGRAATVTRHRFDVGVASGIDVGRADAQLADAEAQLADERATRAVLANAVATLAGVPAGTLAVPEQAGTLVPLTMPPVVPSALLQRRPDIAAAERRLFAANRRIGVARAAWFPQIGLGGGGGVQSTALAGLIAAPNLMWSVGPQMVLPIFDGGRRRAQSRQAHAQWDLASAQYRAGVLLAMQQVEDGLARAQRLGQEDAAETRAAQAAGKAARLSYDLYVKGAINLLDVVTAQTAELSARRRARQIETQRLQVGVTLVRALGGGV